MQIHQKPLISTLYQTVQLSALTIGSSKLADSEYYSRFFPSLETLKDPLNWPTKFSENIKVTNIPTGTSESTQTYSPLDQLSTETIAVATTVAVGTACVFQLLRKAPGFRNSPKTTFLLSAALTTGLCVAASKFEIIDTESSAILEVVKNAFLLGAATTATAKAMKLGQDYLIVPTLNFLDVLSPAVQLDASAKATEKKKEKPPAKKQDPKKEAKPREEKKELEEPGAAAFATKAELEALEERVEKLEKKVLKRNPRAPVRRSSTSAPPRRRKDENTDLVPPEDLPDYSSTSTTTTTPKKEKDGETSEDDAGY